MLVQDAAYMVVVPNICPDTPALRRNPVFFYFQDDFQRPNPFRPDVAVSIDEVAEKKILMLDAHVVPDVRMAALGGRQPGQGSPGPQGSPGVAPQGAIGGRGVSEAVRQTLRKWYGAQADSIRQAEAFELCEYGRRPSDSEIRKLFPFFPNP